MLTDEHIPVSLQMPSPAEARQRAEDEVPLRQEAAPDAAELDSEVDDDEYLEPHWDEAFSAVRHEDDQ